MIVNGREVIGEQKDFQRAANIQADINKLVAMPDESKRTATKDDLKDIVDGVDSFNMSMFDEFADDDNLQSRKDAYETYREMSRLDVINKALELIADDSCQKNQEGNSLTIYSDDEGIKAKLEDLFINRLDFNNELWSTVYDTCTMGDNFYEVVVDSLEKPKKIMALKYLEPEKTERIEIDGKLAYFTYKVDGKKLNKKDVKEVMFKLQPWQVIHFKMEDRASAPYGASLLKAGIRTYKRIVLLEDISLVYRISRAPERRVFYVDVGNLNNLEAGRFLKKFRDNYRTQSFIDESGKINKKANMISITQDIFIPVREGGSGTKIEALQGGTALGGQDDLLKYFKDKLIRMLNIPPAYLGDDTDKSRGGLAALDVNFSKYVERIQSHIVKPANKLASLELYFAGFKKDDLFNFSLELTAPSNIREITELEFINQKMSLIQTMLGLNIFPLNYILKKVLRMTDKEIANIQLYKKIEAQMATPEAGMAGQEMMGAGGVPMGGLPPTELGGMPQEPGVPGAAGAEAAAAAIPAPPAEIPAAESVMVDILGKDFLIENKKDFFKMSKFIKLNEEVFNDKAPTTSYLLEEISNYLLNSKKTANTSRSVEHMKILNEFGGINFNESEVSYFKEVKTLKKDAEPLFEEETVKIWQGER